MVDTKRVTDNSVTHVFVFTYSCSVSPDGSVGTVSGLPAPIRDLPFSGAPNKITERNRLVGTGAFFPGTKAAKT